MYLTKHLNIKYICPIQRGKEILLFDAVVIASPLELSNIQFGNSIVLPPNVRRHPNPNPNRKFVTTFVTFVEASGFSPSYFTKTSNDIIDIITTNNRRLDNVHNITEMDTVMTVETKKVRFSSISVDATLSNGKNIYKIFSRQKMHDTLINEIFLHVNKTKTKRIQWKAYPKLSATLMRDHVAPPFKLAHNLWYINAMENAVSCMETSAVAAKNVALGLEFDLRTEKK